MPKITYKYHLKDWKNLVTTHEETRAGFVNQVLEKNRLATPIVEEARALKIAASQAGIPMELLDLKDIQPALLTAAGVSDKASRHLDSDIRIEIIKGFIEKFLESAGLAFIEELVFRFLLTKGDSLGGSVRNIAGKLAEQKLTRGILSILNNAKIPYWWLHASNKKKQWIQGNNEDASIELHLSGLSWNLDRRTRTLIYNINVPFVSKNVDLCLLDCNYDEVTSKILKSPKTYILLGELKGGIDPAGADEHWKTASKALARIRDSFLSKGQKIKTFFIGAAIVNSMAQEIWKELEKKVLSNAANLTKPDQIASLCRWLVEL